MLYKCFVFAGKSRTQNRGLTLLLNDQAFGMSFSMAQPSKHKTFVLHLYNVGPTSKTLGRRCINVIQMFCVCWERTKKLIYCTFHSNNLSISNNIQKTFDVTCNIFSFLKNVYVYKKVFSSYFSAYCDYLKCHIFLSDICALYFSSLVYCYKLSKFGILLSNCFTYNTGGTIMTICYLIYIHLY